MMFLNVGQGNWNIELSGFEFKSQKMAPANLAKSMWLLVNVFFNMDGFAARLGDPNIMFNHPKCSTQN